MNFSVGQFGAVQVAEREPDAGDADLAEFAGLGKRPVSSRRE